MPPKTNRSNDPHRVPCCCRIYKCYLGKYQDAYGVTQSGVEVLPETFRSHQLAQEREKVISGLAIEQTSRHPPATIQDTLLDSLTRLNLTSESKICHARSSSAEHDRCRSNEPSDSMLFDQAASRDPPISPPSSSKVCLAALKAREREIIKVYDCGELVLVNLFLISECTKLILQI